MTPTLWRGPTISVESQDAGLGRRSVIGTLGVAWQGLVRFLTNLFVGNLAGPLVLGAVASALSAAQILALLGPAGAGSAAAKFVSLARGRNSLVEVRGVVRSLQLLVLAIGAVLAGVGAAYWTLAENGRWYESACVAALVLGLSGWNFVRGVLLGAGLVKRAALVDLATGLVGLVGTLSMLAAGVRGVAITSPIAMGYLLYSIVSWPRLGPGTIPRSHQGELLGFIGLATVGTLSSAGFLQFSVLAARHFDGRAGAGQYAAALTLSTPLAVMTAGLSAVLFPSLARAWGAGDVDRFRCVTDSSTRVLIAVLFAALGAAILLRQYIVVFLWGDEFNQAAGLLPYLLLAVVLSGVSAPSVSAITTQSQKGMVISASSSLAGACIGGGVWLALGGDHGTTAVALGVLVGTIFISLVPIAIVWRRDQHKWGGLGLRILGGSALVGGLNVSLAHRGFAGACASAVSFLAIWLLMNRRELRDAMRAIRAKGE